MYKGGHFIWSWASGARCRSKADAAYLPSRSSEPLARQVAEHLHHRTHRDAGIGTTVGKMWVRSSSETKKVEGDNAATGSPMPNMARGASPDVGSMKAVAEEQPGESRCLARDALPARSSIFFKTAGRQSTSTEADVAQSLEELGSNQQLEGSVSGQADSNPR